MGDLFRYRVVSTSGCEILDHDNQVVAWAVNEVWATIIATVLNNAQVSLSLGSSDKRAEGV